ncbi:MAG: DbpA RNA binding domain-containing protein, partial [Novosphingobium sp.]|nr:DbpA RNA binding domain-containing protein [Novosphingobium sp.]
MMLRGAKINAEWISAPAPEAIHAQDRQRLIAALLEPVEYDDEDRAIAAQLLAERSAEDIAAALVRAHRAAMPQPEELTENTPAARTAAQAERHRPGFDDVIWFRMDLGRRQNADPRWILPLLCRRGHITRNEIGAIRISANETHFQVPRPVADKFAAAVARTAATEDGGDVRIEASPDTPRDAARQHRKGFARAPSSREGVGGDRHTGTRAGNDAKPRADRPDRPPKAWPKKPPHKARTHP